MNQPSQPQPVPLQCVEEVVKSLYSAQDTRVERVMSGVSTYVYRIVSQHQTYYLRILPEEGASFAPEITVLGLLRQKQINVPEVIYFEDYNPILDRPFMIEAEIKGLALSKSTISQDLFEKVALEAGRDLARINNLPVEGFGWIKASQDDSMCLNGRWPTFRAFALASRSADLAYLRGHVLRAAECAVLERVLIRYDDWLDVEQGYLAHGDFDTTHVFHENGQYTGIIDFGEVRSTNLWYDLAHFRIRDAALPPYRLFSALERGYGEIAPFPSIYEPHLRFTSVLINVRALARAFQTRLPDEYIWRQLETLHEDLAFLD